VVLAHPAPTLACLTSRHCKLGSKLTHGIGLRLVHMSALHVLARGIVLAGTELAAVVPIILHFLDDIGVTGWAAPRPLDCLALTLTAVAARDADVDLEATASSSGILLLCSSRLRDRYGCWGELRFNGGGLTRPGVVTLATRSGGSISL